MGTTCLIGERGLDSVRNVALFQHVYGSASISPAFERDLIERVRIGDQLALEQLFHRYYDGLCRFTLSLTRSPDDVEDLVQDIFVRIWTNRAHWNPKGSVGAYLYKAARNQAINLLKSRKQNSFPTSEQGEPFATGTDVDLIDEVADKDLFMAVSKAIDHLPEKCRLVFVLNRREGLTYTEIAGVLEISQKTVENQISHALKILRNELSPFRR